MTTGLTDDELAALAQSAESQLVERKRSASDRSGLRRNICAFANDLPAHGQPGVIFVGLEDNGDCAGIVVNDELLKTLAHMRSDGNILPLPSMSVERKILDGCEVAVILVEPAPDPPVRYQGRVWVKVGPTVQLATPGDESRLAEKRRSGDLTFDQRPAAAAMDELDIDYFAHSYLSHAVASDVLTQNVRPVELQLRSLRLLSGDNPTWGGLMACGRDPRLWLPGAYIQFLRIDGMDLADPIKDQKVLDGRLEDVLRQLDDLLKLNVTVRTDFVAQTREARYPDYPIVALQQLARNAVMHRLYEGTNAPTRITWFADRIAMLNPGGPYGAVTPDNLDQGTTDYRNPLIAEIMHNLGFAQRFGMGLPLAHSALRNNGNPPPEFSFPDGHFAVTVRAVP